LLFMVELATGERVKKIREFLCWNKDKVSEENKYQKRRKRILLEGLEELEVPEYKEKAMKILNILPTYYFVGKKPQSICAGIIYLTLSTFHNPEQKKITCRKVADTLGISTVTIVRKRAVEISDRIDFLDFQPLKTPSRDYTKKGREKVLKFLKEHPKEFLQLMR